MDLKPKVKINRRELNIQISADPQKQVQKKIKVFVNDNYFEPAVQEMQEEFEEHPITQELDGGIEATNISNTLRGNFPDDEGKNLYSFIGFAGDNPTDDIRPFLIPNTKNGPKLELVDQDKTKLQFTYEIKPPDLKNIYSKTPMPWGGGLSWAKRIEIGIPGLGRFLNKIGVKGSRSGGGIQIKNELRRAKFSPRKYLTEIFDNLKKNFARKR